MSNAESVRSTRILLMALSVVAVVLGVACTFWALTNIGSEAVGGAYEPPAAGASDAATSPYQGLEDRPDAAAVVAPQRENYPSRPVAGDKMGSLSIPVLKQTFPIIEGTRDSDLKRGVGHFVGSVLPGEADNSVLSGHRDTVFTRLGAVKIGDRLVVQTAAGKFTYQVGRIRIVDKNDRTVIVPTGHAVLTVSTCYPFSFIGAAPKRYVLVADLVTGP